MNTKLRCLLLDDELPGLAYLKMLCEEIPELEVVRAFDNPAQLLEAMSSLEFDLLISDIEMPGTDGLTLAGLLQEKLVIFITAYKEYAADAFEVDAVDYITKPIKADRLRKGVEKALERFSKPEVKKFTTVNTDKGKALLYFSKVALIRTAESDSRDKLVLATDGTRILLKNISFSQVLQELPVSGFCQINKKEIVAIAAIKVFVHNEITLNLTENGKPITASLNEKYRQEFLEKVKI